MNRMALARPIFQHREVDRGMLTFVANSVTAILRRASSRRPSRRQASPHIVELGRRVLRISYLRLGQLDRIHIDVGRPSVRIWRWLEDLPQGFLLRGCCGTIQPPGESPDAVDRCFSGSSIQSSARLADAAYGLDATAGMATRPFLAHSTSRVGTLGEVRSRSFGRRRRNVRDCRTSSTAWLVGLGRGRRDVPVGSGQWLA